MVVLDIGLYRSCQYFWVVIHYYFSMNRSLSDKELAEWAENYLVDVETDSYYISNDSKHEEYKCLIDSKYTG